LSQSSLRLVVGLGNPGKTYDRTRHNVGRCAVQYLAKMTGVSLQSWKGTAEIGFNREKNIWLALPQTYMNLSGQAVKKMLNLEAPALPPSEILIVCDDFSLPEGSMRLRIKGSSGGHNGLASVSESLGSEAFPRLRIGVGFLPEGADPAEFVLGTLSSSSFGKLEKIIEKVPDSIDLILGKGYARAMSELNSPRL